MMNEKGAVTTSATFAQTLPHLNEQIQAIYAAIATAEVTEMVRGLDLLAQLVEDGCALADVMLE